MHLLCYLHKVHNGHDYLKDVCLSYVPWNLLNRLVTSSTASFTACTGSDTICWMSEKSNRMIDIYAYLMIETLYRYIYVSICDLPGTALYSTKSNITTPTTPQDRRAARAMSSSAETLSFPRIPSPLGLWAAAAAFEAPSREKNKNMMFQLWFSLSC